MIASHGRAGFRATFIGSVADKVVRGSTAPVLVVPGIGNAEEPVFTPVVVPLDGSEEAENALAITRRLAEKTSSHLILVRSYGLPHLRGADFEYFPTDMPEILAAGAKEYLDGVADETDDKVVLQSDPAVAICAVADQYDAKLVVMATSGRELAGRLALGSTTDRVLYSLHRPLLVVPSQT